MYMYMNFFVFPAVLISGVFLNLAHLGHSVMQSTLLQEVLARYVAIL